jgi:predicted nucleotidyltransferase
MKREIPQEARSVVERLASALEDKSDVELAVLFGSHAAGQARPDSDTDVAVLFSGSPTMEDLAQRVLSLEHALATSLQTAQIHLSQLNQVDALFLHQVVTKGVPIFVRDQGKLADLQLRAIKRYLDTTRFREAEWGALRAAAGRPLIDD